MKNFIIKYKLKILLTLFFAFMLLILNNNVFATEVPQAVHDLAYSLNNNSDNYIILQDKNTSDFYFVVISNSSQEVYDSNWRYIEPNTHEDTTSAVLTTSSTGWLKLYKYRNGEALMQSIVKVYLCNLTTDDRDLEIVYTKKDILHYYTGEVFFPVAPPEEELPEVATLQEIMEQMEKGAVLKVILILLPVILSVLVSLIALRKALKMLLNFLRAS